MVDGIDIIVASDKGIYKSIFKSTFLFGFVQIVRILVGVIKNKFVAILLGSEGIGIMGIFHNATSFIKTGAGLGISQSAVRDISEANSSEDRTRISRMIAVVKKVVLFTSLFGLVITVGGSAFLSKWGFGSNSYIIPFMILGLAVFFDIFVDNQLAILKGLRQLKSLAKASIWGAIAGLVSGVPLFYIMGVEGIVPSFVITAFVSFLVTRFYVNKVKLDKVEIPAKQVVREAGPMVKMGSALMFTTLLSSLAAFIVASYIRKAGGLSDVGFYNAGMTIINSYFGVIITALMTDYYPRIAAVNQDDKKVEQELNQQSMVSIVLCCPIIVIFLLLMPFFVTLLYSKEFLPIVDFMRIAMFGTIITIISNQTDLILVAKFKTKIFTIIAICMRIVQVLASILLYKYFGLIGMGITVLLRAALHFTIMTTIVKIKYDINFNKNFIKVALAVLAITLAAVGISEINNPFMRYSAGFALLVVSVAFTLWVSKRYMKIDFISSIKAKFAINKKVNNVQ